jgi:hypothetical protein
MLKKFLEWLTTSTRRVPKSRHPDLYPIDVNKLAAELNLAEKAARLGRAGLPTTDSTSISGPEAEIVQKVEKARQDYVDWAVFRLNILSQDLARRNITHDINRARKADNEFDQKAISMLAERGNVLGELSAEAKSSKAELDDFRFKHHLNRKARYPSGGRLYFLYGVLAVLVVIEGVANAAFFSQGMDSGLIGGFLMAAALAAINVIVAFALGKYLIRYINHRNASVKVIGVLAILAAITCMLLIGLGIAHYRDALTNDTQLPAHEALSNLLSAPFQLQDVFSWALFLISVTFATGSLFDGLYNDDLYPGYGGISRDARETVEDYEDELAHLREQLEELKDEELSTLDETIQRAQAAVAVFESLINDKRTAASRLTTALRDADHSLEALLRIFRTENELHRNGVHRPPYFDQLPTLSSLQLPSFDVTPDEEKLKVQKDLVAFLLVEVEQIRARIQGAFSQKFDSLHPLDDQFIDKVSL